MFACEVELFQQELDDCGGVGWAVGVVGCGGGEGGLRVGVEG